LKSDQDGIKRPFTYATQFIKIAYHADPAPLKADQNGIESNYTNFSIPFNGLKVKEPQKFPFEAPFKCF